MSERTISSNRVKVLRTGLAMRQSDLAHEVGVTRQTILAIEKGRLNPSVSIALKLGRVLREPVDYVFYLTPGDEARRTGSSETGGFGESLQPAAVWDFA